MEVFTKIVNELINNNKTIATMESCTGGALTSEITNVPGASDILKFSAVTYSNEYKIKMGVSEEIINEYSVYSMETAIEMSKNIALFANSNIGVGITGKLNRVDINNPFGEDNIVFISIYDKDNNKYHNYKVEAVKSTRKDNKDLVIEKIKEELIKII